MINIYEKKILVFTNGEKIGDAIIKLPLLHEIKKRLPDLKLIWMTNKGKTAYNSVLKNIANEYIDEIWEQANLNFFFWQNISDKYDLKNLNFEYILDTQKAVIRTSSLKRIKCKNFISASASGFFSTKKILRIKNENKRNYYLNDLFSLLDLIEEGREKINFSFKIPNKLYNKLNNIFDSKNTYIGIAPGAGEENKVWDLNNFIKIAKFLEKKSIKLVFFLGPNEYNIKDKIISLFPNSIIPEDLITEYSGTEIVMASTKFLKLAISNDSGVSHMLSTGFCQLIKLFGPKNPNKFTPLDKKIITISSNEFGSKNINDIKSDYVLKKINELIFN